MTSMDMRALNKAMCSPDDLVVSLRYTDKKGVTTERVVSPIRGCRASVVGAVAFVGKRRADLNWSVVRGSIAELQ